MPITVAGAVGRAASSPSQVAAAANPWNTYFMAVAGDATFSESNQRATIVNAVSPLLWTGFGFGDHAIEFEPVVTPGVTRVGFRRGPVPTNPATQLGNLTDDIAYLSDGTKSISGSNSAYGATFTNADKILMVYRSALGTVEAFKNGASQGILATGLVGYYFYPGMNSNIATTSVRVPVSPATTLPSGVSYWI